jgi:hypothetical protein
MNRLHRLIASAYGRKRGLAVRTKLRHIIVNGSAFCAVSGHLFDISNDLAATGLTISARRMI